MKNWASAFAVSGLAFILAVAVGMPAIQRVSEASSKTAGDEFKNLQVLKNIQADELVPSMQFISASLGVECEFCHDERDKSKDDKKTKQTAREMMRMMQTINQNNFSGQLEVTCNTCHRGSIRPQPIPAVASAVPKPAHADMDQDDKAAIAAWSSGNSVMAKYLDALGGRAALEKVTTRVEKGNTLLAGGRDLPIEIYARAPDLRVSVMRTTNGDSVTGYNGNDGWLAAPGRPLREMSAPDQYGARLEAVAMFPEHLSQIVGELKVQPHPETVGDHAATVVWGIAKDRPPVKLYFDAQTGLLLRMLHYTDTAFGLNPIQVDYADYRDVGGIKTPFRWTIARPSGAFTIQIDSVQDNTPIDAARFQKPSQPAALPEAAH